MADMAVRGAVAEEQRHEKYLADTDFQKLVSARRSIAAILTVLTLMTYYGFIFLMAYGKGALSTKISANITLGLPIGVAVIVISWILVFTYANWANKKYDQMVEDVHAKMGG